jgi:hypothetical protein
LLYSTLFFFPIHCQHFLPFISYYYINLPHYLFLLSSCR